MRHEERDAIARSTIGALSSFRDLALAQSLSVGRLGRLRWAAAEIRMWPRERADRRAYASSSNQSARPYSPPSGAAVADSRCAQGATHLDGRACESYAADVDDAWVHRQQSDAVAAHKEDFLKTLKNFKTIKK